MNLQLREVLRDPRNEAVRVVFDYKGILVVVKVFDPDFPMKVSLKLMDEDVYLKTKSFWNTTEVVVNDDDLLKYGRMAAKSFYRYANRIKQGAM
jgi:hypothetical protein